MIEPIRRGAAGLPENRQASPFTGWTREHWIATADLLLDGVRPYASPGHALIRVPGPHTSTSGVLSDGLEGFARTFLLAAYRLAASNGRAPGDLIDRYSEGLRSGSDRRSDEAWPVIEDYGQPVVEAAFVALALAESRPWLWEASDDKTRQRVVDWLSGIRGKRMPSNNWVLFPVVVQAFLKSVGAPYRQDEIDHNLDLVDSWYRRDGWYTDGPGENFDYYNAWGIHFHTLMWSRLDRSDQSRAEVYRQRLFRFLEQYRFLFGADGAPVYHGRSLTYRFAAVAPLWMGALLDSTPIAPGETRRVATGALRHFLDRGAVRDGVLTLGWYDEFLPMIQSYSGHGSPYWASEGFCGLLLAPDHPAWTETEQAMPVERSDFCVAMPAPGFLVRGTAADGIVRMASHRSDHLLHPTESRTPTFARRVFRRFVRSLVGPRQHPPPVYDVHYAKLGYSSHAAPGIEDADVDSQVSLLVGGNERSQRVRMHCLGVADRFGASVYSPRDRAEAGRIETVTIAHGRYEIRVHHVSVPDGRQVRDGGFAVADTVAPDARVGDGWSWVRRSDGLTSLALALHGFDTAAIHRSAGTNAFGPESATPYLTRGGVVEPESVFISLIGFGVNDVDAEAAQRVVTGLDVSGREVTFSVDGEWWFLQMVSPEHVERTLGGRKIRGAVRVARVSPDGTWFAFDADGQEHT